MKRIMASILLLLLCLSLMACNSAEPTVPKVDPDDSFRDVTDIEVAGNARVVMSVAGYGEVIFELYTESAPQSVYNFIYLARGGFFDGLRFHEISEGVCMYSGMYEPLNILRTRASCGLEDDYSIRGEFEKNGVSNPVQFTKGTLAWSRPAAVAGSETDAYNGATTQFFICFDESSALGMTGDYAPFGKIISGYEVIEAVVATAKRVNGRFSDDVIITSMKVLGDAEYPAPDFIYYS